MSILLYKSVKIKKYYTVCLYVIQAYRIIKDIKESIGVFVNSLIIVLLNVE